MTGPEADLTGWVCEPFSAAGFTHDVYRKGSGPGVVLIPEMPGVHPGVLALGVQVETIEGVGAVKRI